MWHRDLTKIPFRCYLRWSLPEILFCRAKKKDDIFIFTSLLQLAAEMVFAPHRQQCCTERNCQQAVAFSERLLSAALLGCACTPGFSLCWSFSSCCLPVSFNRKALAALAWIRSSTSLHSVHEQLYCLYSKHFQRLSFCFLHCVMSQVPIFMP